jgi:hypothetical protein
MQLWIFEANAITQHECLALNLFGSNRNWALQVRVNDICFLYNYDEKKIYGVWLADCNGALNIEPEAWQRKYPFQVKVKRAGSTIQSVPKANVWKFICKPDSGYVQNKLWGDSAHNLVQHFAHLKTEAVSFGVKFDSIEEDYRRLFPKNYTAKDGHPVRSKAEMIIDNYLYDRGNIHAYEPMLFCKNKKLIPDFLLKNDDEEDVCIEYWGLLDNESYVRRMEFKKNVYAENYIRLIDVTDHDLTSPELFLEQKLINQKISRRR